MDSETLIVVDILAKQLDTLEIPYYIGGSVASSLHGMFRATNDVDIVVSLQESNITALVSALEGDFYVDADMIHTALQYNISFNVIHLPTMIKADLFPLKQNAFGLSELARRQIRNIRVRDNAEPVYVASPEDMVLQKLLWYRETGERSDRQWGDVQGILKVQAYSLDFAYMTRWADEIGVADLLITALDDAGLDTSLSSLP
jgi:hypothetical protein